MLPQYLHCSLHLTWYPQHCSNTCGSRSPVSPEHLSNCLPQTQAWRNCENPKRGTIPAVKLTAKICSTCWLLLLEVDCVSVLCVSTPLPFMHPKDIHLLHRLLDQAVTVLVDQCLDSITWIKFKAAKTTI